MRSTLPYRPPLPTSSPRRRVASMSAAAPAGHGSGPPLRSSLPGTQHSIASMSPRPRTSARYGCRAAMRAQRGGEHRDPACARSPAGRARNRIVEVRERARRTRAGCRRTSRCCSPGCCRAPSARPMTAPSVSPLPTPFASVMRSGIDAVRLVAPEVVAGATEPGLHLVGDEEDPVLRRAPSASRRRSRRAGSRSRRHPGSARRSCRRRRRWCTCRRRRAGPARTPRCTRRRRARRNGLRSR